MARSINSLDELEKIIDAIIKETELKIEHR